MVDSYGNTPWGEDWGDEGPFSTDAYLGLVTSQYQSSSNFLTWLGYVLTRINDVFGIASTLSSVFDIDSAIGAQLDVIGIIVGQSRTVDFQPSNGVSPKLDDITYRIFLKARIAQNNWDGKLSSLYAAWAEIFPDGVIVIQDNQDMTAAVIIAGNFTSILQDLINHGYIVPRPQGVLYTYAFNSGAFFGFDENSQTIAGFDAGIMR